jgi:polyhydroxyalkanoate synthase
VGKIELYRYLPKKKVKRPQSDPLLIVYSLINKSYILDLMPGYSFIQHLLDQGLEVYLIEWGGVEPGDRSATLDSYIEPGISDCVEHIQKATGAEKVSLFGHCMGGNLAAMYAALYPEQSARLITLTTPMVPNQKGVVALWTNPDVFPVDAIIDAYGHMPAKLIRYTFMAIKPYLEVMKWKMFLENLGNDQVMTYYDYVDTWANDNVDIPGEVFRKYIKEVLHEERFARSQTHINRKRVDLTAITCPLMNLAATKDWIVPEESARPLNRLVTSKENYYVPIEGTHVGIMIEPQCRPVWDQMSDFLKGKKPATTS